MTISIISLIGYLAAIFVALSFYMKTMVPLRLLAIGSNIAFVFYAYLSSPPLYPVLVLHLFLLPLNFIRLWQMKKLIKAVQSFSQHEYSFELLIPYMYKEKYQEGHILFKKGDKADKMFLIQKGRIQLPEVNHINGPGDILGEMGVLGPDKKRTTSAICLERVSLLSITDIQVITLCYQNPKFGFYLTQTVIKRFIENHHEQQNGR